MLLDLTGGEMKKHEFDGSDIGNFGDRPAPIEPLDFPARSSAPAPPPCVRLMVRMMMVAIDDVVVAID